MQSIIIQVVSIGLMLPTRLTLKFPLNGDLQRFIAFPNPQTRLPLFCIPLQCRSFPTAIDDGADFTVIGNNTWQVLQTANPEIRSGSRTFSLGDGFPIDSHFLVLVDITIVKVTGSVTVRRHWVHVLDADIPDVLLGRPLLLCLGIDVEKQLCDLGQRFFETIDEPSDLEHHLSRPEECTNSGDEGYLFCVGKDMRCCKEQRRF
uniref:Peptidase A2 domain-containing protein n=1 Tax=Spongospora subterranea TaxID=70186 RepID=A0A0H5QYR1_9EUKA|eukprot:CRZ06791.1 hypothetical protein [Spongospora subterranea]